MQVVPVPSLEVFLPAALVTGRADVLHALGVIALVVDYLELGCDLLETLLALETGGVPVVSDGCEDLAHYLLVAGLAGELALFLRTGGAVGFVILIDELAALEGTLTAGTDETLGVIVVSADLDHGVLDKLGAGVALGEVGVGVALFAEIVIARLDVAVIETGLAGGTEETGGVVVTSADGLVGALDDLFRTAGAVHVSFIYY